jgi:peroxiredoxin
MLPARTLFMMIALAGSIASGQGQPATQAPAKAPPPEKITIELPEIGMPAPSFALPDTEGKLARLGDLRGHVVVLCWVHAGCAEVKSQFENGPMGKLPAAMEAHKIQWLAINPLPASDPLGGAKGSLLAKEQLHLKFPLLVDPAGLTTKSYAVTKSPTVAVIDAEGVLRYIGAIDNAPLGVSPEGEKFISHLERALTGVIEGKTITKTRVTAYGCDLPVSKFPG